MTAYSKPSRRTTRGEREGINLSAADLAFLEALPTVWPDQLDSYITSEQERAVIEALASLDLDADFDADGKVADVAGGKVAEDRSSAEVRFSQQNKGCGPSVEKGRAVKAPSTPNHTPHSTPFTSSAASPCAPLHDTQEEAPETRLDRVSRLQPAVAPWLSPEAKKKRQAHKKRQATRCAKEEARLAPPTTKWKVASSDEKFRYAGHATQQAGGTGFTLRLSPDQQKRLMVHPDPCRAFSDTLNRELKDRGLSRTPYALTFECSAKEELHLHGVAVVPEEAHDALKDALRAAGGVVPKEEVARQVKLSALDNGAGWASYSRKDVERVQKVLSGEARPFLSREMTRLAKEFSRRV